MSAHEPKIVEQRQVTNELVAYRLVCCGESCSEEKCANGAHACEDTWHTFHVLDPEIDAKLAERKSEVAKRHAAIVAWRSKAIG